MKVLDKVDTHLTVSFDLEEVTMLSALIGRTSAVAPTTPMGEFLAELHSELSYIALAGRVKEFEDQFSVMIYEEDAVVDADRSGDFLITIKNKDGDFV
ncbi:hypothetical protein QE320_gp043 [Pseudomonas phage EM]|uniref:Uncharacterized protein n=1 Tax=Pseudomonas phage EM TaxID=2936914 RepID=A0AAE9HG04_9CAUD|nr:hypothetical protein QE320_gp043 [Pseudomonas phage EM]UPW35845.1 hypothetical protein EM_043 [Pseudomonas phage EM]